MISDMELVKKFIQVMNQDASDDDKLFVINLLYIQNRRIESAPDMRKFVNVQKTKRDLKGCLN